jgi:hypothetical protein
MKQQIYKSWKYHLNQSFWIEERFTKTSYDEMIYNCCLKTMRYISNNLQFANGEFKKVLKQDLRDVREYYLSISTHT